MAVSKRLRAEIFRRDNSTCHYCGAKAPAVEITIDHVVPVTLGGSDDPSNLVTACADCNNGKTSVPPNAATVKQVSEDAFRWASAMEAAAEGMLGGRKARDTARAAFDEKWKAWSDGRPPIPRPEGWGVSVDNFLKAGLPLPVLLDCVDIAMSARHIKADDVFKYMCGVAWKEIRKLQDSAKAIVGAASPPPPASGPEPDAFQDGRYDLASNLLSEMSEEDQEKFREQARDLAENPDDEIEVEVDAAQYAFSQAHYEMARMRKTVESLMTFLPEGAAQEWREIAMEEINAYMGEDFSEYDVLFHTVRLAVERRQVGESNAYLGQLSPEERHEWEVFTQNRHLAYSESGWYVPLDPSRLVIETAKNVREVRENQRYWSRMCSARGEHIFTCPQIATHRGSFGHMECCAGKGIADHGHPLCEPHLAQLVDGTYVNRRGLNVPLIDFKAIEAPLEVDEPPS